MPESSSNQGDAKYSGSKTIGTSSSLCASLIARRQFSTASWRSVPNNIWNKASKVHKWKKKYKKHKILNTPQNYEPILFVGLLQLNNSSN